MVEAFISYDMPIKERISVSFALEHSVDRLTSFALVSGFPINKIRLGEKFPILVIPSLEMFTQLITSYLEAPTISYEDWITHSMRRAFSLQVESYDPELYLWLQSNRLRYNNILALYYLPIIFETELRAFPRVVQLFNPVIASLPLTAEIYENLSIAERILVTSIIGQRLKDVFVELQKINAKT